VKCSGDRVVWFEVISPSLSNLAAPVTTGRWTPAPSPA